MTEFCDENSKRCGGNEVCCLHDLPDGDRNAPGRVCCWCGDVYLPHSESSEHGEFKPTTEVPR